MRLERAWILIAACNILLLALTAMVNDVLAGWSVSVFLAGPCIIVPALYLEPKRLLACLAISGLAADTMLPTPPGFLASLLIAGAALIVFTRARLGAVRMARQAGFAWLANAAFFAALTVWAMKQNHAGGTIFIERTAVDFCLSQAAVIPISLWFFDFQESVLAFAGLTARRPRSAEAS